MFITWSSSITMDNWRQLLEHEDSQQIQRKINSPGEDIQGKGTASNQLDKSSLQNPSNTPHFPQSRRKILLQLMWHLNASFCTSTQVKSLVLLQTTRSPRGLPAERQQVGRTSTKHGQKRNQGNKGTPVPLVHERPRLGLPSGGLTDRALTSPTDSPVLTRATAAVDEKAHPGVKQEHRRSLSIQLSTKEELPLQGTSAQAALRCRRQDVKGDSKSTTVTNPQHPQASPTLLIAAYL